MKIAALRERIEIKMMDNNMDVLIGRNSKMLTRDVRKMLSELAKKMGAQFEPKNLDFKGVDTDRVNFHGFRIVAKIVAFRLVLGTKDSIEWITMTAKENFDNLATPFMEFIGHTIIFDDSGNWTDAIDLDFVITAELY